MMIKNIAGINVSLDRLESYGWRVIHGTLRNEGIALETTSQEELIIIVSTGSKSIKEIKKSVDDMFDHCIYAQVKKGEIALSKLDELYNAFNGTFGRINPDLTSPFCSGDRFYLYMLDNVCRFCAFKNCRPEDYGIVKYILRDVYSEEEFVFVSPPIPGDNVK